MEELKIGDIEGFLAPFLGKVESISCVNVMSEPKSEDPEKLVKLLMI